MLARTDLAVEAAAGGGLSAGIKKRRRSSFGVQVTEVAVLSPVAAKKLGKPQGRYITVETGHFGHAETGEDDEAEALAGELRALLPEEGVILVAGLGNRDITPDALGPRAAGEILATRHLLRLAEEETGGSFRPVAVIAPGVLGQTGFEAEELIRAAAAEARPCAVIAIDALAAREAARLGRTVQLSDTGICPGSGVANSRRELSRETLGVPVVAIGVPTVVDAAPLCSDEQPVPMMVTPREIDLVIKRAAHLLALSINRALQPSFDLEELKALMS